MSQLGMDRKVPLFVKDMFHFPLAVSGITFPEYPCIKYHFSTISGRTQEIRDQAGVMYFTQGEDWRHFEYRYESDIIALQAFHRPIKRKKIDNLGFFQSDHVQPCPRPDRRQ